MNPNVTWLQFRDRYLDELLRHDGRGGHEQMCGICKVYDGEYKCKDCFGPRLLCLSCLLKEHSHLPLHRVQVCHTVFILIDNKTDNIACC